MSDQQTDDSWNRQTSALKAAEILKDLLPRVITAIFETTSQVDRRSEIMIGTLLRLRGMMITLEDLATFGRSEDMGCLLRLMAEWAVDCAYLTLAGDDELERFVRFGEVNASRYLRNFENSQNQSNPDISDETRSKLHENAKRIIGEVGLTAKATSWTTTDAYSRAEFVDKRYSPPDTTPGKLSYAFRLQVRGVLASAHSYAHPSYESLVPLLRGLQGDGNLDTPERRADITRFLSGGAMALSLLGQFANTTRSLPFGNFFFVAERILLNARD